MSETKTDEQSMTDSISLTADGNDANTNVVMDHIVFSYGKGTNSVPVLSNITLNIYGPQLISIVGPNGVGKSTLIHCINKILRPNQGVVSLDNTDVGEIPTKEMARIVGYVPYTSSDSFPLSVVDTIMMGRFPHSSWGSTKHDLEVVEGVLELLKIEDLALRPFNELSAGQHQKVMLARGLAQEPKILLLDEPTSNLDIKYQLEITRILRDLSHQKGIIIIMISHDINIASKYSDNMIMLKNGGIYAVGRPQEVITEYSVSDVYDVKCKVVDDNGRPHVILIDKDDCGCDECKDSFVKDCL